MPREHIPREKQFPVHVLVFLMLTLTKIYFFRVLDPFHATGLFLYPLKKPENQMFYWFFMFSISEPKRVSFIELKRNKCSDTEQKWVFL